MAAGANQKKKITPLRRDYLSNKWNINTSYRRVWEITNSKGLYEEITAAQLRQHLQTVLTALDRPELGVLTIGPTQADELSNPEKEALKQLFLRSELIRENSNIEERQAKKDFEIKAWLTPSMWIDASSPDFEETLQEFYEKLKGARDWYPPYLCAWPIVGTLRDQFPDYDRIAADVLEISNAPQKDPPVDWRGNQNKRKSAAALSISDIQELLRLKLKEGLGHRETAKRCGVSIAVVSKFWKPAVNAGLNWVQITDLTPLQLLSIVRPTPRGQRYAGFLPPRFDEVERALSMRFTRPMTLKAQWQKYRNDHPGAITYSLSRFCALYKIWLNTP